MFYVLLYASKNKWIALILLPVFFIQPFFIKFNTVVPVYIGCLLIPCNMTIDILNYKLFLRILSNRQISRYKYILITFITLTIRFLTASSGGYIQVISACMSCGYFLMLLIFEIIKVLKQKVIQFGIYRKLILFYIFNILFLWAIAVFTLSTLLPPGTTAFTFTEETYNSSSVHIATLLLPEDTQISSTILPSYKDISDENQILSGSDTQHSQYVGLVMLICCIIHGICINKTKKKNFIHINFTLLLAIIFLILAIGPSFKWLGYLNEGDTTYSLSMNGYLATPWKFIYTIFPFRMMRAVNRWLLATKWLMPVITASFLGSLIPVSKKYKWLSFFIAFFCIIDVAPVGIITGTDYTGSKYYQMYHTFKHDTVKSIKEFITPGSRIVIAGKSNAYCSSVITAGLSVYSYTGSGDKAVALANPFKPSCINNFQYASTIEEYIYSIRQISDYDICDYILFPFFDIRYDFYIWPSNPSEREIRHMFYADVIKGLNIPNMELFETEYYYVLKLNQSPKHMDDIFISLLGYFDETPDNIEIDSQTDFGNNYYHQLNIPYNITINNNINLQQENLYYSLYIKSLEGAAGNLTVSANQYTSDGKLIHTTDTQYTVTSENYVLIENCIKLYDDTYKIQMSIDSPDINSLALKEIIMRPY